MWADTTGLPASGLPLVCELVHERTGLFYGNGRADMLAERLAPIALERGFRSFLDLYYLLKYDAPADVWRRVMDALSVQETYFWREIDQIRAVASRVLPRLVEEARGRPIRIWSSPCATGEEPLTIAMVLDELGWFDRAAIEIDASDGSASAIARARDGRYRARAFRVLPPALQERYFVREGEVWRPVASLAARVRTWSVVNLLAREEIAPLASAPIVFCRNAMIYFSPESVKRLADALAELMPAPGYLCLGASESLLSVTTPFALEEVDGAFVYVKRLPALEPTVA
jgi:chemotaxis protein methyltransferase CheR